jgi:histidinol phosphatase-like enzyme/predicted kinase
MQKTLTLVCGLPGNGKTTLAKKLSGNAIAADDYPDLYIDGVYKAELQKKSHEWCQETVEEWLKQGAEEVIVHNTFTRNIYRKPYIELAKKYGYSVHIVTSEAVILPSGERTTSTHNVPDEVLESMRIGWEAFNPVPKLGITASDIAAQMTGLQYPDAIIFDMDKTIKRPKDGRTFPSSPDDFEITLEFQRWAKEFCDPEIELYIVSNQRGIGTGQKTVQFLKDEAKLLTDHLETELDICFASCQFATHQGGRDSIKYYPRHEEWIHIEHTTGRVDKPGTQTFISIFEEIPFRVCWIVGDSHTDNASEDWQFAQACQKLNPRIDVRYVPIELLNVYWSLI